MARTFSIVTSIATVLSATLLSSCTYVRPAADTSASISTERIAFIRQAQRSTIAQASEMDTIRLCWENLLKAIHADTRLPEHDYDTISAWQDLADLYALEDESDRTVFVLLGAQLGWRYDQTPLIRHILSGYAPKTGSLLPLFRGISEEDWYRRVEEWPHKDIYPFAGSKLSPSLERTTWDICTDRCDIITAITQHIDSRANLHISVANVAHHAWVTLFETQTPCKTEEDRQITINDHSVRAHFYCPQPNVVAADFPDDAARRTMVEAINSGNPITLGHVSAFPLVHIANRGGAFVLSSLDINTTE
ncbi:hypothetical protein [Zymobacter palmae]|uniref:Serine phosphatase RsbU, regulator of sigma n=1 Tax=Zymobacter palmae TaxID=33074 RepID=A0A348HCD7_9GAMM|nr:hypothetical protein [Zymobacter palmae]BBG29289.1 serine phosphatase RsbU, regulator of sigma [Zymobacter palmae]